MKYTLSFTLQDLSDGADEEFDFALQAGSQIVVGQRWSEMVSELLNSWRAPTGLCSSALSIAGF